MRLTPALLSLLIVIGITASAAATAATPAGEKEAQRAVEITAALEANPFAEDAEQNREWLSDWVTGTPDYMVKFCDILGPIPEDEQVPNGRELLQQHMFGNVSYQIRNPGTTDVLSLQVAAMESLLKVYAFFLDKDPKGARIRYFDRLLTQQRKGTLREHLAPVVAKRCVAPLD